MKSTETYIFYDFIGEEKMCENKKYRRFGTVLLLVMIVLYSTFLFYKVGIFPNVFLDEGNCMYDSWCMAFYGLDSNLLENPVYLPGYLGQGQSILYAFFAGFSMKIFGYNLFAYRLPLLLISILNYVLLIMLVKYKFRTRYAVLTALVVGTSPYVLTVSRWGMDCNVAPFIASIGMIILYYGYTMRPSKWRQVAMCAGGILLGLVTYSYNVGWMFIPFYLLILLFWTLKNRKVLFRDVILPLVVLFIIEIPIMIFAVRSNISQLNTDKEILWWTSPSLLVGRVKESFISFDGNILKNIVYNLVEGLKMFLNGTDQLSWNSVGNIGPYYMFVCPFFIIGLVQMIRRRGNQDIFVLSALVAMIPIMMIVTPNYNHWIFLHFPVLITIVIGICSILESISKRQNRYIFLSSILGTYALFSAWFSYQYFHLNRYTGWETSAIPVIQSLDTKKYDRVYFDSDNDDFLYFIRFCIPISPYEYQETRDNPYSKTLLGTTKHYDNFEKIEGKILKRNSLIIIEEYKIESYEELLSNLESITSFTFSSQQYNVYQLN